MTDLKKAAATELLKKRDSLVEERTALAQQRVEILQKLRRVERDILDVKAAARVFDIEIEFPPDEREEYDRDRDRVVHERIMRNINLINHSNSWGEGTKTLFSSGLKAAPTSPPAPTAEKVGAAPSPAELPSPTVRRPAVREVALEFLKVSPAGAKAGDIREFLERSHGIVLHDKTVGMTLYRLSKEGLVHRRKFIWFFGPPLAEAGNPGGATPGPETEG